MHLEQTQDGFLTLRHGIAPRREASRAPAGPALCRLRATRTSEPFARRRISAASLEPAACWMPVASTGGLWVSVLPTRSWSLSPRAPSSSGTAHKRIASLPSVLRLQLGPPVSGLTFRQGVSAWMAAKRLLTVFLSCWNITWAPRGRYWLPPFARSGCSRCRSSAGKASWRLLEERT